MALDFSMLIQRESFMKNSLYIFSLVFLLACVDKRNMMTLKKEVENDLRTVNNNLHQTTLKFLKKEVKAGKIDAKKTKSERILNAIKNIQQLETAYLSVLELINKAHSNANAQNIYQKYHAQFIKILEDDLNILESVKEHLYTPKELITSPISRYLPMKEIIKMHILENHAIVFERFFAKDFGGCGFDIMSLITKSKSNQIVEGENMELKQFLHYTANTLKKKYDYTFNINQGSIKREKVYGAFTISIPTQKTGKQSFEVIFKLKDWETDKDTTLYFTKTFEVIE